ncbi:unnamed protein product [Cuscuta campestris]|uniref:Pentacotripeptide-repeat region of PRORP domain-containing protein n=1 Tax=Cuscuta campestris TaxID=132261 RepID=A0A484KER2_9ASTE|nr:unnamed protein product [Cuscuta campestris]
MNLKHFIVRRTLRCVRKLNNSRVPSEQPYFSRNFTASPPLISSLLSPNPGINGFFCVQLLECPNPFSGFSSRFVHTANEASLTESETQSEDSEDSTTNEFLSRFVWVMRKKLNEMFPDEGKCTIDGMLLIIVEKVASGFRKDGIDQSLGEATDAPDQDFSPELWRTVLEVSNSVLDDMHKATRKEKLKMFLQSEEVKEMYRFAGEIGIRGDLLRELRFKWAREKMEESEFYEELERLREEAAAARALEEQKSESAAAEKGLGGEDVVEESPSSPKVVTLPKRHGKVNYKIYGLDLSGTKWAEVADKVHAAEAIISPQELKPIFGKCKLVTEKILSLHLQDDPAPLLAEWVELLQPSRIDWLSLLDKINQQDSHLYFKIAEDVLGEVSFEANLHDYWKLIDAHAKGNRFQDAERIVKKMYEKGFVPDVLTSLTLVRMYCKTRNVEQANKTFEDLRVLGFQPDANMYNSMIMTYVNAGKLWEGEKLLRDMQIKEIEPSQDIYIALLRSYAQFGDCDSAVKISTLMQMAGFQPSPESQALLIEAYGKAGKYTEARRSFDYLLRFRHKPDDRCISSMIAVYEKENQLQPALNLLLNLEKDGIEPGVATYSVMVDWLSKMQLIDEAEQIVDKIAGMGEAPPYKINVSLCSMYARAGVEKKALQALSVVEAKKDQLQREDFNRIIEGLESGGFMKDAQRIRRLKELRGWLH